MHFHRRADDLATNVVTFLFLLHSDHSVNSVSNSFLGHPNDQSEIKEQQRRGEKQTVQEIERAANSREQIARILYVRAALDDGFSQIAKYCGKSKKHTKNCRVGPSQRRQMTGH